MFKPIDRTKKPITFKDMCCIYPSDNNSVNNTLIETTFLTDTITTLATNDEWVDALKDILESKMPNGDILHLDPYTTSINAYYINSYIFKNYGRRKIFDEYFESFSKYENTSGEIAWILALMFDDIHACVNANIYRWSNLVKSTLLDFNPLWNVDGVTGEIRETTHTGTDTDTKSGFDKVEHDGYYSDTKSGNHELEYLGEKYNEKLGREITANTGTDTTTTSRTTTESDDWWGAEKNATLNGKTSTLTINGMSDGSPFQETEYFENRKDKTTFNNEKNKHDIDYDDKTTYNSSISKLLNLYDKDLFMQIKQGNIGVTTTTKLLTEFRDYVNFKIVDIISKDIVNSVCKGVY